jgi:hypothetical protein
MWLFNFYRFYCSLACGILQYFLLYRNIWVACASVIIIRALWYLIEQMIKKITIQKAYNNHVSAFKQLYGPYGIRLANKAETQWRIKESMAEVFAPDITKLKKTVEQLEVMDTLFQAGMRPEGDEFLLHDLKLKYGKYRLEQKPGNEPASGSNTLPK